MGGLIHILLILSLNSDMDDILELFFCWCIFEHRLVSSCYNVGYGLDEMSRTILSKFLIELFIQDSINVNIYMGSYRNFNLDFYIDSTYKFERYMLPILFYRII